MPGTTLTVFRSRTADRNPRAMRGAVAVGTRLAARLGLPIQYCGEFEEPLGTDWKTELEAARPALQRLGRMLDSILSEDRVALTTLGRCASSIATLPVVARHRSDALGGRLPASRRCWEFIGIEQRELNFLSLGDWLTC